MEDALLRYCIGFDAGLTDDMADVLRQAETDEGLDAAIQGIHRRFDSNESFTEQLQRVREQLQKESE